MIKNAMLSGASGYILKDNAVDEIMDCVNTVIDGETYYTIDGAQYKPVVQENGEIWYEVIKAN